MVEVIGWTIVVAFIATTVVTILSMVGFVKLTNPKFLDRLFAILIVEIVAAGFFLFNKGFEPEDKYFTEAGSFFQQALDAKNSGNIEEADVLFTQVLKVPADGLPLDIRRVFLERGHMAYELKIWNRAAAAYEVYDEIGNEDLAALINYGRSLRELNRYEEAVSIYERAQRISPNNYFVLNGLQNVSRRLAGFYQESERPEAAERLFEKTRSHINAMIKLSENDTAESKKHLNALLARVRLNWQWERYSEAEAAARQVISRFPDYDAAKEDLAAILLESGKATNRSVKLEESAEIYQQLYRGLGNTSDDIYVGSGLAEAIAFSPDPTEQDLDEAKNAVLLSIANTEDVSDDPYAFYAAAVLFNRLNEPEQATTYLEKAIRAERRRSSNPFTFDYVRLVEYEKLLLSWQK